MPTTLDEIDEAKDAALDAIDDKLVDARTVLNASTNPTEIRRMNAEIRGLRNQRTDILMQDYVGQLTDPEMTAALNKISQATKDMKRVAANMKSATAFISSLASFFSAVAKVVPALKGF